MCPSVAIRTPNHPPPPIQRRKSLFVIKESKIRFLACLCVCVYWDVPACENGVQ